MDRDPEQLTYAPISGLDGADDGFRSVFMPIGTHRSVWRSGPDGVTVSHFAGGRKTQILSSVKFTIVTTAVEITFEIR